MLVYHQRYCHTFYAMKAKDLISEARRRAGLAQDELARRAGTSQSAVARLERPDSNPTLSTLQRLVEAAGFDLRLELVPKTVPDQVIAAYKRDVDRTLLRENLRKSIDERLRSMTEAQASVAALQRAVQARNKRKG